MPDAREEESQRQSTPEKVLGSEGESHGLTSVCKRHRSRAGRWVGMGTEHPAEMLFRWLQVAAFTRLEIVVERLWRIYVAVKVERKSVRHLRNLLNGGDQAWLAVFYPAVKKGNLGVGHPLCGFESD